MRPFETLNTPEQIRALARPERLDMLRLLRQGPRTGATLARELGLAPNVAHYHLGQLLAQKLIREHGGRERSRRNEEKFYIATAANYLVDPSMGVADPQSARTLLDAAETVLLDQRRHDVLKIDLPAVARRIARRAVPLSAGQSALIMFGPHGAPLAEALGTELELMDVKVRTKFWSHQVVMTTLERFTPEEIAARPFINPDDDRACAAVISIVGGIPQGKHPGPELHTRLKALMETSGAWQRSLRARRVPEMAVFLAHRGEFEGATIPLEDAVDAYWRGVMTDPDVLGRRGGALRRTLAEHPDLTLRTGPGAELRLRLDPAMIMVSDGVISPDDLSLGHHADALPAGGVRALPVPGSAEGEFHAAYVFSGGQRCRDVRFVVRAGRLVEMTSTDNIEPIRTRYERAVGDKDRLATVLIGLNPEGRGQTGKPLVDGLFQGSVTVSFGSNERIGGGVRSTIDLQAPAMDCTLTAGPTVITEAGSLDPWLGVMV